ncbi:hypothetical protein N656DRAFT_292320 [Canariomyces notabilis]|uniref:Zn(2)-C6 fungal-type domain-containing protein n=1 Tax=Canariomyces notabilis TaxID=2074819 RepID=A0AAN6TA23_9PEZI|nr:hypothetical protein N656DRAFT_292320 [Canariomyces arenarius]
MTFHTQSESILSSSKRSACDRCRHQKLRCPRGEHASDSEPCNRCARLGTKCVTSYRQPLGRRTRSASTASATQDSDETRAPYLSQLSGSFRFEQPPSHAILPERESHSTSTLFDHVSVGPVLDAEPHFSYRGHHETQNQMWSHISCSGNLFALGVLSEPTPPSHSSNAEIESGSIEIEQEYHGHHGLRKGSAFTPVRECDQRLSQLNLNLSTLLDSHSPWLAREPLAEGALPRASNSPARDQASPYPTLGSPDPWSDETLGDLLRYMAEFISIMQSYTEENANDRPRLGTVIQLNLLSVHLQIVAICDELFRYLCHHFCQPLCPSSPSPPSGGEYHERSPTSTLRRSKLEEIQPLPGLQLAGFHVQHGTLQARLLLHTVLHHFSLMERMLGLPDEWRVVGKRDASCTGLLENEQGRLLLDAIGTGNVNWTERHDPDIEGNEGLAKLHSLRGKIKTLQQFIEL